jgi:hypothetical protein
MQVSWRTIVRSVFLAVLAAGVAFGADQTILGQLFVVKSARTSKVAAAARERDSTDTLVGDPTMNGATVTITADGGTSSTQTFTLPASNWRGNATRGFKYNDSRGTAGAIKQASLQLTRNRRFLVKVLATSKTGTLSIVPPNPGSDACVLIEIGSGDSYSIRFGPDSRIRNRDGRLFQARRPASRGTCVTSTTTTSSSTSSTLTLHSTTTTTLYGSPSRAFLRRVTSLMD